MSAHQVIDYVHQVINYLSKCKKYLTNQLNLNIETCVGLDYVISNIKGICYLHSTIIVNTCVRRFDVHYI